MNWGGIIAGAVGGGAQAVGQIADDNLKEAAAERQAKRSLELNFEKFKQETDYKLQKEAERRGMLADQGERLMGRADANMRGKDAMAVDLLNNKVAGEAPDMSQAEIAQLLKDNPEYRQVWEQAGYMDPRKQSGIIGEQITAAREIGADPEIRKDLQDTLGRTLTAERDAARQANDDRRYERQLSRDAARDANDAQRMDLERQRVELLAEKLAGSGPDGKKDVQEKLNTTISTHRLLIKDYQEERKGLKYAGTPESKARLAEIDKAIAFSQDMIGLATGKQKDDLTGVSKAPPPAPAAGAKAGGKPAWQSQQAYDDEVAIKLAEWAVEKDPAIKAGIRRELLRIGVDPEKRNGDNQASAPTGRPDISSFMRK